MGEVIEAIQLTEEQLREPELVHVLVIKTGHGSEVYVCRTPQVAYRQLDEYVRERWGDEMEERAMPEDPESRLKEYFVELNEKRGEECYTIWKTGEREE